MKIVILGYGKMGKAIDEIAKEREHEIVLKIDSKNTSDLQSEAFRSADVVIEFTQPELAIKHILHSIAHNKPIVVGTTGWYDEMAMVKEKLEQSSASLLAATNFSVGVNLFFELNRKLAKMMALQNNYRASMIEIHHTQKLDSPSGTAITLAEELIENSNYTNWINERSTSSDTLGIQSVREEDVPGTHEISYQSEIDKITITHEAFNRKGFALGAVLAAEFIYDKTGLFSMKDVLKIDE